MILKIKFVYNEIYVMTHLINQININKVFVRLFMLAIVCALFIGGLRFINYAFPSRAGNGPLTTCESIGRKPLDKTIWGDFQNNDKQLCEKYRGKFNMGAGGKCYERTLICTTNPLSVTTSCTGYDCIDCFNTETDIGNCLKGALVSQTACEQREQSSWLLPSFQGCSIGGGAFIAYKACTKDGYICKCDPSRPTVRSPILVKEPSCIAAPTPTVLPTAAPSTTYTACELLESTKWLIDSYQGCDIGEGKYLKYHTCSKDGMYCGCDTNRPNVRYPVLIRDPGKCTSASPPQPIAISITPQTTLPSSAPPSCLQNATAPAYPGCKVGINSYIPYLSCTGGRKCKCDDTRQLLYPILVIDSDCSTANNTPECSYNSRLQELIISYEKKDFQGAYSKLRNIFQIYNTQTKPDEPFCYITSAQLIAPNNYCGKLALPKNSSLNLGCTCLSAIQWGIRSNNKLASNILESNYFCKNLIDELKILVSN